MKKLTTLFVLLIAFCANAQETANRFFYELTFKPKKEVENLDKVLTVLDITKEKSIYKDFTMSAQDSIMKVEVETMKKTGVYKDFTKSMKMPKFGEKIYKFYPDMKIQYVERVANGFTPVNIGYDENLKFDWKISTDKQKIGTYNTQKATTEFGGRKWTAWFTSEIPFQDGPYKFYGLPGLIVKIEDEGKNYSWELKGNKKVSDYSELSYLETVGPGGNGGPVQVVSKEKFDKTFNDYKKDPFATARPYFTPEMMSQKMPGSDTTIGEMVKQQEKLMRDFYDANNNPIEINAAAEAAPAKKKGK